MFSLPANSEMIKSFQDKGYNSVQITILANLFNGRYSSGLQYVEDFLNSGLPEDYIYTCLPKLHRYGYISLQKQIEIINKAYGHNFTADEISAMINSPIVDKILDDAIKKKDSGMPTDRLCKILKLNTIGSYKDINRLLKHKIKDDVFDEILEYANTVTGDVFHKLSSAVISGVSDKKYSVMINNIHNTYICDIIKSFKSKIPDEYFTDQVIRGFNRYFNDIDKYVSIIESMHNNCLTPDDVDKILKCSFSTVDDIEHFLTNTKSISFSDDEFEALQNAYALTDYMPEYIHELYINGVGKEHLAWLIGGTTNIDIMKETYDSLKDYPFDRYKNFRKLIMQNDFTPIFMAKCINAGLTNEQIINCFNCHSFTDVDHNVVFDAYVNNVPDDIVAKAARFFDANDSKLFIKVSLQDPPPENFDIYQMCNGHFGNRAVLRGINAGLPRSQLLLLTNQFVCTDENNALNIEHAFEMKYPDYIINAIMRPDILCTPADIIKKIDRGDSPVDVFLSLDEKNATFFKRDDVRKYLDSLNSLNLSDKEYLIALNGLIERMQVMGEYHGELGNITSELLEHEYHEYKDKDQNER